MTGPLPPTRRNRASLAYKIRYAARNPDKIRSYLSRVARDLKFRVSSRNHIAYYRAVMKSDTARDPEAAVGSRSHERWLALGQMQFDYLLKHGLKPDDRILEIGCGNLRAAGASSTTSTPGTTTASTSRPTSCSPRRTPSSATTWARSSRT